MPRRGGGKHGNLELGDLYKISGDDYRKDKRLFGIDVDADEEGDLSPNRGPRAERLPALENAVENSGYRNAITEPLKIGNPLQPRYT